MGARHLAALACAVVSIAACSSDAKDPAANVVERQWDVIGEVAAAEFGDGYTHEPAQYVTSPGGPGWDFQFLVGPATLTMADGTTLDVPARTPGGNSCTVLLTEQDKVDLTGVPEPTEQMVLQQFGDSAGRCFIVAGTAADGRTLEWFQVVSGSDAGVGVGGAVAVDASGVLTDQGLRFRYADGDVPLSAECGDDATLAEAISAGHYPVLVVGLDGTVVAANCPGRE